MDQLQTQALLAEILDVNASVAVMGGFLGGVMASLLVSLALYLAWGR